MNKALTERIHNAVLKMQTAKKSYEIIVNNESDKDQDYYKNLFSNVQTVYDAVDILLGCFVEEKRILLVESGGVTNTSIYCKSILHHNEKYGANYLTDVDFNQFLKDKNVRNLDTHKGVQKKLQEVYRVFYNLNKILLNLDSNVNKEIVPVDLPRDVFNFETFYSYMGREDEERRYVLISEPLHNIDDRELELFLELPWSVVLDFDTASEIGGLKTSLISAGINFNSFPLSYVTDENNKIDYVNRLIHIDLSDGEDLSKRITASEKTVERGGGKSDKRMIEKIFGVVRDTSHPYATIVVVGPANGRINQFCTNIAAMFRETEILMLTSQEPENPNVPEVTAEEDIGDGNAVISKVYQMNSSVFSAFRSIYENRTNLQSNKAPIFSDTVEIRMPNSVFLKREFVEKYVDEVEFLHCGLGKDSSNSNEWEFYHGDVISWDAINAKCALPLIGEGFEAFVKEMKSATNHKCFYIYHRPGFGGTTLGRQLAWAIHENMPVVRLKKFKSRNDFMRLINDLYVRLEKHTLWLLVDENCISDSAITEIEKEVKDGDYNVCAIIVRRVSEKRASEINKTKKNNEIVISILENTAKNIIETKCAGILHDQVRFEARKQQMDSNLEEKYKCPLLINLYLLEDDFKLDTFVSGCLEKIPDDYDKEKMRDLIAFMAIGSYYANIRIPESYCKQYLGIKTSELNLACFEGILLKRTENRVTYYVITHFFIAEEILRQILMEKENYDWKGMLPQYVLKYIDWIVGMLHGMASIDDEILNILGALFTDKTRGNLSDYNDTYKSNFTMLLMDMDEYHKLDVMLYLANKYGEIVKKNIPVGKERKEYRMLAHIYAQLAKVRLEVCRINEDDDEKSLIAKYEEFEGYIRVAKELVVSENICDYALEDIIARCSLTRAKKYKERLDEIQKEDADFISHYVNDALIHFSYAIWYGSPDYGIAGKLDALYLGMRTIIELKGWDEDRRVERINDDEIACAYLEDALSTIQDIEEYNLSDESKVFALNWKDRIERLIYPEKPSDLLQRLDNIRNGLDAQDYRGHYFVSTQMVHAYERKYYDEKYRRATLIQKAFEGNSKAKDDAKKVFDNLDKAIKMSNNHSISHSTYYKWFEYAKFVDAPLTRAKEVAKQWRDSEAGKPIRNAQFSSLIKPYYYLFVVSLLQYKDGIDGVTADEVNLRKYDLKKELKQANYRRTVQDWFCVGKGIGQLYSREWIDIKDVAKEERIVPVKGRVVDFDEKTFIGYLQITSPKMMGTWSRPSVGSSYSKDAVVRFSEDETKLISMNDIGNGKEIAFKMGFSYDNFEASMNSIEMLNYRSTVSDKDQSSDHYEETQDNVEALYEEYMDFDGCDDALLGKPAKCIFSEKTGRGSFRGNISNSNARVSLSPKNAKKRNVELGKEYLVLIKGWDEQGLCYNVELN